MPPQILRNQGRNIATVAQTPWGFSQSREALNDWKCMCTQPSEWNGPIIYKKGLCTVVCDVFFLETC